jgi:glycosyltransferase involved in cell wall biosynthesis
VVRDARAVLFTCEQERQLAAQSFRPYRCHGLTANFGTTGPSGDLEAQRRAFFARYPELQGKDLVLYLGRIHSKKGCDLLVEAFADVAPGAANLHLVMAGMEDEAGLATRLRQRAKTLGLGSRITWTGQLPEGLKWGAFLAASVFSLPSHQENFGLAVAEALACGLPVLISNKVNIWHEIEAAGAGLVAEDDLDGTVSTLRRWVACGPGEQDAMRRRAVDCFTNHYQIERAAQSLVRTLRSHDVVSV